MREPATFLPLVGELPAPFGEPLASVVHFGHLQLQLFPQLLDVGEHVVHEPIERRELVA